jgi:hypothetical protein
MVHLERIAMVYAMVTLKSIVLDSVAALEHNENVCHVIALAHVADPHSPIVLASVTVIISVIVQVHVKHLAEVVPVVTAATNALLTIFPD